MPLVLLAPRVTPDSVAVWREAMQRGWRVERLGSWRVPSGLAAEGNEFVIYAEPLFAEAVADQLEMILLEPPPEWLAQLPVKYRKRDVYLSRLGELRSLTRDLFIKPAEGKVFEAKVYATAGDLPPEGALDDDMAVICSEPVTWDLEVRCFIRNRELMTCSPYWRHGNLAQDERGDWPFLAHEKAEAIKFAGALLADGEVPLPPAFVLDVGLTREHGWAVVEGNPCWGAGLYGCDVSRAMDTIRGAVRPRSVMTDDEWGWTSPRVRPH